MKLEIHERSALLSLLPKEENFAGLKAIRRAKEIFSLTPEEAKHIELTQVVGADGKVQSSWNPAKAQETVKDCPIEEYIMDILRKELSDMNKKHKLTDEYASVFEKLVVMYRE